MLSWVLETIIQLLSPSPDGSGGAFTALRSFRLLRILRSLKIIKSVSVLKDILATTAGSVAAIVNFAVLLFVVLYIYALCGMMVFGGHMQDGNGDNMRPNFDSLLDSITAVFIVLTRENWQELLYTGMRHSDWRAVLYFVSLIVTTNYVLLSLFIGTLLENFERFFLDGVGGDKQQKLQQQERLKAGLQLAAQALPAVKATLDTKRAMVGGEKKQAQQQFAVEAPIGLFGLTAPSDGLKLDGLELGDKKPEISPLRLRIRSLVTNAVFETIILVLIAISSACLAFEHPLDVQGTAKVVILEVLDIMFVVIFSCEAALKLFALGAFKAKVSGISDIALCLAHPSCLTPWTLFCTALCLSLPRSFVPSFVNSLIRLFLPSFVRSFVGLLSPFSSGFLPQHRMHTFARHGIGSTSSVSSPP